MRRFFRPGKLIAWLFLAFMLVISVFPVLWMVRTALTYNDELFQFMGIDPPLFPQHWTLDNFRRVLGLMTMEENQALGGSGAEMFFWTYLLNSLKYTAIIVTMQVGVSVGAGYALARLQWRGRQTVFLLLMTGLLVPGMFATVPNYVTMVNLHLVNTQFGVVAPYVLGTPFAIFYMRQFFLSFPKEVEEAAELDGLGPFARLRRIVLPMSWPPILTLAMIVGVTAWNEYLWPFLMARDPGIRPLTAAIGVFKAQNPSTMPDYSGLMTVSTLTVLPVVLVLLVLGKRMVGSLQMGGMK